MTGIEQFEVEFDNVRGSTPRNRDAKIPTTDKLISMIGLGPIPPTKVFAADAIVKENNRLDQSPADGELTLTEQAVRAGVLRRAGEALEKDLRGGIEQKVTSLKKLYARINLLTVSIGQAGNTPLVGPDGEQLTQEEAQDAHDTLRDQIGEETAAGSKKHLIRRRSSRAKEIGSALLDFPVFLLAMIGLLNVNLRLLVTFDVPTIIMFGTAVVFALLGTFLFAFLMRTMGHRHRRFKNADSAVEAPPSVRHRILAEQIATITITVAAALVMVMRIYLDGTEAGAPAALTVVLAALFGVLIGVTGYINYMSEYENGSEQTDRVQHLSAQLAYITSTMHTLRQQRAVLIEEAGIQLADLARMLDQALAHATSTVTGSSTDKAIAVARSYYGSRISLPDPTFPDTTMDLIKKQMCELAGHHDFLTSNQDDRDNQEN
ncbi:hypothetical protein [Rhodococcus sp. AD45]|uniref:hypothetical protein n=1 Tax=Rhodococcus sp. (strain AD45) TaxID=103808 RepID=UPI0005D3125E|nr:hypothetical protein [Rhodococcus sp. AD45]KJF19400.1 hypothetical protein SZ00_06327 [Rhodococcus sp. AD45]